MLSVGEAAAPSALTRAPVWPQLPTGSLASGTDWSSVCLSVQMGMRTLGLGKEAPPQRGPAAAPQGAGQEGQAPGGVRTEVSAGRSTYAEQGRCHPSPALRTLGCQAASYQEGSRLPPAKGCAWRAPMTFYSWTLDFSPHFHVSQNIFLLWMLFHWFKSVNPFLGRHRHSRQPAARPCKP